MTEEERQKAAGKFGKMTGDVQEGDIGKVLSNPKVGGLMEKLGDIVDDVKELFSMLQDYWSGEYKQVPWKFIASVVAAFLYLILPIDVIPDFIPFVGFLDDAAVFGLVFTSFKSEIEAYRAWKNKRLE